MNKYLVSVVIVSYNTCEVLKKCLESLRRSKGNVVYEVIVVDNASTDHTVEMIKKFTYVRLIENNQNVGFATACNQGVKIARGEYVWLLNSDTWLYQNTLHSLWNLVCKNSADIASCQLINPDGSLQSQGGALPNLVNITLWMTNLDYLVSQWIPMYQGDKNKQWVSGTAMMVKKRIYENLKGFDEHIFMYGEDIEFCIRAVAAGYKINYFPQVCLVHVGQKSGSLEKSIRGEFEGLKYIWKKHKSLIGYNGLRWLFRFGCLLRIIIYSLVGDRQRRIAYAQVFKHL